jgi:hypothetical protein
VGQVVEQIRARSPVVYHTCDGGVHFVLARDFGAVGELGLPVGVRCAFTPPRPGIQAPEAWRQARNALRFTTPSTRDTGPYDRADAVIMDSSGLGAWAVLGELLTAEAIAQVPEVQRLGQLYQENGPELLRTLQAVAATDSLRKAAKVVHMHHNSVRHRVERAESALGFSCTGPYGRARLLLALTLHRLLESRKLF